jgi:hypothetical protein
MEGGVLDQLTINLKAIQVFQDISGTQYKHVGKLRVLPDKMDGNSTNGY